MLRLWIESGSWSWIRDGYLNVQVGSYEKVREH